MHFCESFGLSKLLTGRENGSQKGITGREFVFQISLPDHLRLFESHFLIRLAISRAQKFHKNGIFYFF